MPVEINVPVIGTDVIGLAIARDITQAEEQVLSFGKNSTFGLETSSQNSEVMRAGMYCPQDPLNAKLCAEGRDLPHGLS